MLIGKSQNLFSQSTKLCKAFRQSWQFQQNYRFSWGIYNYWHSGLNFHFKTIRINILVFTEDLIFFILSFLSCGEFWCIFLKRVFCTKVGGFCWQPWGRLGPTCSNPLFCSQLDLSDAKQLGYFFLREKMSFVFQLKKVSFPYSSVSYILAQQSYSPHDLTL